MGWSDGLCSYLLVSLKEGWLCHCGLGRAVGWVGERASDGIGDWMTG